METQTHKKILNLENNGSLEINYHHNMTKVVVTEIVLKTNNSSQSFFLGETWINNQPAQYLKGFKAQIIENDFTFDAKIVEGTLYLFSDSLKSMKVNIKYGENIYTFSVSPNLKLKGLDALVENTLRCTDFIITNGKSPLEGPYTLGECDIYEDSPVKIKKKKLEEIFAIQGTSTKEIGQIAFFFVDFKNESRIDLEKAPPKWRLLKDGLNLIGKCFTKNCKAINQTVYLPQGTGTFNIIHTVTKKAHCPACNQKIINISNCIFWNCHYTVEDFPAKDKESKTIVQKKQTPRNIALSFTTNDHIVEWKSLTVTCSPVSSSSKYFWIFSAAILFFASIYTAKRKTN